MTDAPPAARDQPSAPVRFLRDRLEARNENGFWLTLTLLLGAAASVAYLVMAFRTPLGLPTDARQFLSWMGRWDDPSILRGDLVADYWESVSPWFYRAVFHAAWWIGIAPAVFVKLLPALLYPLVALFAFRLLRAIGAEPLVACLTAALILYYFTQDDSMVNGSPRAFWPMLLLAVLDGLARMRIGQTVVAQLLLSGCYPQMTLLAATVIGLTLLDPSRPWRLDLSRRRIALVGASAVATIAGSLPFLLDTHRFDPVVTLAQARHIATFGFGGRNQIFEADGSIGLFCGRRLGMFGIRCRGTGDPRLYVFAAAALAGPVVLLVRALRRDAAGKIRSALPFFLLVASLGWFAAAELLLLRLHLPSRYTAALIPMAILTVLALLLEAVRDRPFPPWLAERRAGRALLQAGTVAVLALCVFGAASTRSTMRPPADPALIAAIRALPPDAVVAGFVDDLDLSPVLTGRSTLFNRALTIGYQLGYLDPMLKRMADMRDVLLTHDPAVVAERLTRNRVSLLLVDPQALSRPQIPPSFRGLFDADLARLEDESARGGPTALAQRAGRCTTARFAHVVALAADCLAAQGGKAAK